VKHRFRSSRLEHTINVFARGDIDGLEGRVRRDSLRAPRRQIVEYDDTVAIGEQRIGNMRADEAGASGDNRSECWHLGFASRAPRTARRWLGVYP
jgi:hypothetical protein